MSNVNMTVNVDGDGCGCACPPTGSHQVRVSFEGVPEGKVFGPLSLDSAEKLMIAICTRADVESAAIEVAGT